ncbi:hypothetical protein [Rhodococcus sp. WMMA185]|nr:hypothetical protein [Rhodococcus sp. WMMA185]
MTEHDEWRNVDPGASTDLSRADQILMLALAIAPISLAILWHIAQGVS